jgi:hypothetical protein
MLQEGGMLIVTTEARVPTNIRQEYISELLRGI